MDHFLTQFKKINAKCIKGLNVRPETIKLPEEIQALVLAAFFTTVSSGKGNKGKNKYMELYSAKCSFFIVKEIIKKFKRQPNEYMRLITKIYQEFKPLDIFKKSKKSNQGRSSEQTFFFFARKTYRQPTDTLKDAKYN